MPEQGQGQTGAVVEDLFLLDDLKALDLPWVTEFAAACDSHEDVEMLWSLLRAWGPNNEDVEDLLVQSRPWSQRRQTADRFNKLARLLEAWRA